MGITKVAIIGGGISGLSTLHFLKKKYHDDIDVTLYEANPYLGGNIRSLHQDGFIFETGPNGFINNAPTTLELIEDLGLTQELISADAFAKRRYIQLDGKLHLLPSDFPTFIKSSILTPLEKFLLVKGMFNKKVSMDQSISDYVTARFCKGVAEKLADPFIRGIFGGDIKKLHMAQAFPKMKKGTMTSLKGGMGQIFEKFEARYAQHIIKSQSIEALEKIKADRIISTVPAYKAATLTNNQSLSQIRYCTVSVVGLGFDVASFKQKPDGFGYLIPSNQGKDILGVLIESNVYANRAPEGKIMVRVMIAQDAAPEALIQKALKELDQTFGLSGKPVVRFVQAWPKAIPQYEMNYAQVLSNVHLQKDGLTISGNFIKGISLNDCINNAKDIANSIKLC